MRNFFALAFVWLVSLGVYAQKTSPQVREVLFDDSWLFIRSDVPGAEQEKYTDTQWRKIDLPHDWSVEDLPNQIPDSIIGPFDKGAVGGYLAGFTVGGTGWYRKHFATPRNADNKRITIYFDGVYMNSDVWINGRYLGNHPHGYTAFHYDLTPYLKPAGQENVLAVRVRNEGKTSRWYSGSGIYRHVWLTVTDAVHVAPYGVYITTPEVSEQRATVRVQTSVVSEKNIPGSINVVTTLVAPDGKTVGNDSHIFHLPAGASHTLEQQIAVPHPALWSIESPRLYKAVTEIKQGVTVLDRVETIFGIRSIRFDARTGFTLNGREVILRGGCIHHDNGPLGAAAIDRAEIRKVQILKQNGFNAIRSSHNPPSRQLLDACDSIGMVMIDEAFDMWIRQKNDNDYHLFFEKSWDKDLTSMILRDRNHPSIILWSVGNEIPERADSAGIAIRQMLVKRTKELDPSRLTTEAICRTPGWEKRTPAAFAGMDVAGYNYVWQKYEPDHELYPERIIIGTESYPSETLENTMLAEKHSYVLGDFVWTAFDYMGEASIGNTKLAPEKAFFPNLSWPWFNAFCGDFDLTGNKKTSSYYRDVVWRQRPIALAVHTPIPSGMVENVSRWGWPDEHLCWTWPGQEGEPMQVRVFSRAPMVRLYLNGKAVAEQAIKEGSITAEFSVPYQAGTLKAVNVENGKETDVAELHTAGSPKRLHLTADRAVIKASRNDLSYVLVEVVDARNQPVTVGKESLVKFTVSGAGEIAGVGSGNPMELASFQRPERNTYQGKCMVILRPTGKPGTITLKATVDGLDAEKATITVR